MALVALDGRWIQVNKFLCELLGYTEAEMLASTFQSLTHPDDLEAGVNFIRQAREGAVRSFQKEKRYIHKQGHTVHVLLSVSQVRAAANLPLYFIAQILDIGARKKVE